MYVYNKDLKNNTVILGDEEKLYSRSFDAENINLITCESIDRPIRVKARVRYKQVEQWATVGRRAQFHPCEFICQRANTKGQADVLYAGIMCRRRNDKIINTD